MLGQPADMLLRWSLGLVLLAAMIAQSFCQCSVGRKLEEVDEDSKSLQYVSTAQDFTDALKDGVRHVVVTEHLDLSGFSKKLSTSTCGFEETTSTVSIQVLLRAHSTCAREQRLRKSAHTHVGFTNTAAACCKPLKVA